MVDETAGWVIALVSSSTALLVAEPLAWWRERRQERREQRRDRFTKLHDRRVEVMDGLMERLVALRSELGQAGELWQNADDPLGEKHLERALLASGDALRYFEARKFYLPKRTAEKVGSALEDLRATGTKISSSVSIRRAAPSENHLAVELLERAWKSLRTDVPRLMDDVEREFRQLVDEDEAPATADHGAGERER